ncbi:MAG: hypothetical protein Q8941_21505 [Bacteroidota bacterium]|nr:hypothetical protein [Bacteroidota bacterium]
MNFINPIEILHLQNAAYAGSIDTDIIKREKRKLFTEIELSDNGFYHYNGVDITKSDCERVINELDNEEKKEFYYYLTTNPSLNDFLTTSNEKLFSSFSQESIYKIPEFIAFINPFFSERFDKILLRAFKANDTKLLASILRTQILVNQPNINVAFKSVSNEIKSRIDEVNKMTEEIKNKDRECDEESIKQIVSVVKNAFPVELINSLPSYFQSQINKIGSAINYLDVAIDNEFGISVSSVRLMEHLLKLNIESVGKKTFENNFKITKRRYDEKIEQEKNAPLLKKWAIVLQRIRVIDDEVENKTTPSNLVIPKLGEIFSIQELNSLPSFAQEIKMQIAFSIRSLSISIWNKQGDIKNSLKTIDLVLLIDSDTESKIKFQKDKADLLALQEKYKGVLVCHFCDKNSPDESSKIEKTLYLVTNRSRWGNTRRVQYSTSAVTIPRCKNCKQVHEKGNSYFYLTLFGIMILGGVIGGMIEGQPIIIAGLIGSAIGYFVGKAIENNVYEKHNIKSASNSSLSKHPLLIDRIRQGWTFSKPSA